MSCRWIRRPLALVLLLTVLSLVGCGGGASNSRYYMIDAVRKADPQATANDAILAVARFTIDSAYADRELVYRLGEFRYESDGYNEFIVSPAVMVTEQTRDWLADSGLFAQVVGLGSGLQPTYRLEANVTALYGDFRDSKSPQAVLGLKVFLLELTDGADPVPVFSKTYRVTSAPDRRDPDNLVMAFSQCMETILTEMEADLSTAVTASH